MKKQTIINAVAVAMCAVSAQAQSLYIDEDFESGIPSNYALYDCDSLPPSVDMQMLGFAVGIPWISLADGDNRVACSTSWYKEAGTSDDWLVTPAFRVAEAQTTLSWRARASDALYRDGYAVLVSTRGNRPADFDAQPVFETTAEQSDWTSHSVSLAAYYGQQVWVAFVNRSTNCSCLYIDDIKAGVEPRVSIKNATPRVSHFRGPLELQATVSASGDPVNHFTLTLGCNGETFTQAFDTLLTAGSPVTLSLAHRPVIERNQTLHYTIAAQADGSTSMLSDSVTCLVKGVLAEDYTGTWCQYCPKGMVSLDSMSRKYPDNFVGVAVHCSDVMACDDYASAIHKVYSPSGYPSVMMNRNSQCVLDPRPSLVEAYFKALVQDDPVAGIDASATANGATGLIDVNTTLWFADSHDSADYRLAFVLVEDSVHCPGDNRYSQSNAYAGGAHGEMGGYENLPETIPSEQMYFNDVVRGFYGDFGGVEGSVPSAVCARQPIDYSCSMAVPDSVLVPSRLSVIVLLTDGDSQVHNAMKVAVGGVPSSISPVRTPRASSSDCYSLDGRRILEPRKGLYISGGKLVTVKKPNFRI